MTCECLRIYLLLAALCCLCACSGGKGEMTPWTRAVAVSLHLSPLSGLWWIFQNLTSDSTAGRAGWCRIQPCRVTLYFCALQVLTTEKFFGYSQGTSRPHWWPVGFGSISFSGCRCLETVVSTMGQTVGGDREFLCQLWNTFFLFHTWSKPISYQTVPYSKCKQSQKN